MWDPSFGDINSGKQHALTSTAPTISNGLRAIQATAVSQYASVPYVAQGLDNYVIYCVARWTTAEVNTRAVASVGGQISVFAGTAANIVRTAYGSPSVSTDVTTTYHGRWHVIAARRVAGSWQTFAKVLDGPFLGVSTNGSASSPRVLPTSGDIIAGAGGAASGWHAGAGCALIYVDERPVTEAEVISVLRNPWQLFERRIWVPQSAVSGVPTLSLATVTDITASSARPRVTLTF